MYILEDLYNGEVRPCDKTFSHDARYQSAMQQFNATEKKLAGILSGEAKRWLEELIQTQCELEGMLDHAYFQEGVRLGVLLMLDVFAAGEPTDA